MHPFTHHANINVLLASILAGTAKTQVTQANIYLSRYQWALKALSLTAVLKHSKWSSVFFFGFSMTSLVFLGFFVTLAISLVFCSGLCSTLHILNCPWKLNKLCVPHFHINLAHCFWNVFQLFQA